MILCALMLVALSLVSCKKKTEPDLYFRSVSSARALTSCVKIDLKGASFDEFLNRGLIKVKSVEEEGVRYGVMTQAGEIVLPATYRSVTCSGDFLVAEGGEEVSRQHVFSREGVLLYVSDDAIDVTDVGGGYFSVVTKNAAYLLNGKGEDVLPGSMFDQSYVFSACGNYVLARSAEKGRTFIFHTLTSDVVYSFFNSETTSYIVAYLGGSDFAVVKTDLVDSSDYDVALDRGEEGKKYYKQTARRYTAGVSDPVLLSPGRFIVKIVNAYSFGMTEEARESFSLREGYQGVGFYETVGKAASGALSYYVGDASLTELKLLPAGVSPLLTFVNGTAAVSNASGAICFINESAEVTGVIDDAVYQDVFFSGEVAVASKVTDGGVLRRGGFDKNGKNVIPFEYAYISAFVGSKATASKGGKAYVVTSSGAETYVGDYAMPYYFDGFYETKSGDFIGVTSFDGAQMIAPTYQSFSAVRRYGDSVYVALSLGTVTDVYRLY